MGKPIYCNNSVLIEVEYVDNQEAKVNCNGQNLIWISIEEAVEFENELTELLNKYRI